MTIPNQSESPAATAPADRNFQVPPHLQTIPVVKEGHWRVERDWPPSKLPIPMPEVDESVSKFMQALDDITEDRGPPAPRYDPSTISHSGEGQIYRKSLEDKSKKPLVRVYGFQVR